MNIISHKAWTFGSIAPWPYRSVESSGTTRNNSVYSLCVCMSQWDWSVYGQEWTCCVMTGCRINPPDRHLIRFAAVAKWNEGNVWCSINPCIGSHCVFSLMGFFLSPVSPYIAANWAVAENEMIIRTYWKQRLKLEFIVFFYNYTLDSAGNIFDSASCLLYFQLSEHPILSVIKDQINHFTIRLPDKD